MKSTKETFRFRKVTLISYPSSLGSSKQINGIYLYNFVPTIYASSIARGFNSKYLWIIEERLIEVNNLFTRQKITPSVE